MSKDSIIGIDPGLGGAIAHLDSNGSALDIWDMPTNEVKKRGKKKKREVDAFALGDILAELDGIAFVEQVSAMPGQGVTSMFNFGRSYGIIIGALAALEIPTNFIHPATWKPTLRVPREKDAARARASELLPAHAFQWERLKKHDGRAEAALIALYGLEHQDG